MTLRGRGSGRSGFRLRTLTRGLALVLLAAPVMGCSLFHKDEDYVPDTPADRLYNEGLFLLNDKQDYKEAAKKFDQVDRENPYSDWARKALLMSAYAYYQAGQYDDCINAAKRYVTLHPGSPDAAYAQFLIGSSYYDQILDVTRDQERADKAITAFEEVVHKYPDSEYALAAKKKIEMARDQLAGKEMEIGRFYLEQARLPRRHQSLQGGGDAVSDHARSRGSAGAADRSLCGARHRRRGADRGRRARPQFPGQPLVQGRLQLCEGRRAASRAKTRDSWISRAFKKLIGAMG